MRSAACWASHSSLRASACIDIAAFAGDALTKIGVGEAAAGDEIDRSPEQFFRPFLEGEIGWRVAGRRHVVELDQEVEVAVGRVEVVADGRAEDIQSPRAGMTAQLGDFFAGQVDGICHGVSGSDYAARASFSEASISGSLSPKSWWTLPSPPSWENGAYSKSSGPMPRLAAMWSRIISSHFICSGGKRGAAGGGGAPR